MLFTWLICLSFQGTFLMTQAVAKVKVDQGVKNGSIVNLASIVGKVRKIYMVCCAVEPIAWKSIGSFSINKVNGTRMSKQQGLLSKTTSLHVHRAFLYISLLLLHDCDGKCLISRFIKDITSDEEIFFLFLSLSVVPKKSTLRKVCLH